MREWYAGAFELLVSPHLLAELREVLERPKLARDLSAQRRLAFLAELRSAGMLVEDPPPQRFVPRDPDDDYLVGLARAGRAQVIVTGDADLLEANTEPPAYSPQAFLLRLAELPF